MGGGIGVFDWLDAESSHWPLHRWLWHNSGLPSHSAMSLFSCWWYEVLGFLPRHWGELSQGGFPSPRYQEACSLLALGTFTVRWEKPLCTRGMQHGARLVSQFSATKAPAQSYTELSLVIQCWVRVGGNTE